MDDLADPKAMLRRYLQDARDSLVWKVEGLDERAVRLPRTPTGTSLLGIVKHCANVEIGYFGDTFGRQWPYAESPGYVPMEAYDADPHADWYPDPETPAAAIVSFYRKVWDFADQTIESLDLDAPGQVPWWPADRRAVTLRRVMLHVTDDLTRHAGQADILRELADGAVGLTPDRPNIDERTDWAAHVARLTAAAEQFGVR